MSVMSAGEAAYATAYNKEARDAHGRWIKGFGAVKATADKLLADGKITKPQHQMLMQAASRHAALGRGIPEAAQHSPAKMLDYLASTMRGDVKQAYDKEGSGSADAKVLGRTARAVENVAHAAHGTSRTGRHTAITHPPVHPDDMGDTFGTPKVVSKANAAPKVVKKASDEPTAKPIVVKVKKAFDHKASEAKNQELLTHFNSGDKVKDSISGRTGVVKDANPANAGGHMMVAWDDKDYGAEQMQGHDGKPMYGETYPSRTVNLTNGFDGTKPVATKPAEKTVPGYDKHVADAATVRAGEAKGEFTPEKYNEDGDNPYLRTRYALRSVLGKLKGGEEIKLPDGTRIVSGNKPGMAQGGVSQPTHYRVHYANGTHQDLIGTDLTAKKALDQYGTKAEPIKTEPPSLRDQQKGVKLPDEAHTALKNYVTGEADGTAGKSWADRTISKRLRGATPLSASQQKYADNLDAAFNSVPATEKELTLHRGIDTTKKSGVSQLPKDLKVGDTFGDKGYMSTSLSSKVAEDFATKDGDVLHLTLPAGAHPIDVNAHISGAYGAEREVLIPRGAQIKVTSIKDRVTNVQGPKGKEDIHSRHVYGELILPDAPKDLPSDTNHEVQTEAPQDHGYAVAPAAEPLGKNDFDVTHIQKYKDDATKLATEFSNESFDKSGTSADDKAIENYSNGESNVINPFLRTGKHTKQASWPSEETPDGLRAKTKALDDAIAKSQTKQNIVVYRGVSTKFLGDAKPGDTITDKGFVSTSQTPHVAGSGAWMHAHGGAHVVEIRVPAGAHAASINQLDDHIHAVQGEVLLPRDSVFRVVSTGDHPVLELVPNAPAKSADETVDLGEDKTIAKAEPVPTVSEPTPVAAKPLDKAGLRQMRSEWTAKFRALKSGESIEAPGGHRVTYEGGDVWAIRDKNGTVVKRHVYATRVARQVLERSGIGVGSADTPEPVKAAEKAPSEPKVVTPKPTVVKKAKAVTQGVFDKLKGPKVVKKMGTVKVSAADLRPGDIVSDGRIKFQTNDEDGNAPGYGAAYTTIPHQRTVISAEKLPTGKIEVKLSAPLNVPENAGPIYIAKKYGNGVVNEEITREASPTSVSIVKREVESTKATGSKITLDKAPTTKEFKAALESAMQDATSPGDISHLDPANRPMPKGHTAGHAQQIMYDLAVGKLNGITRTHEVKSDEDYRKELNAGAVVPEVPAGTQKELMLKALQSGNVGLDGKQYTEIQKLLDTHIASGKSADSFDKELANYGSPWSYKGKALRDSYNHLESQYLQEHGTPGALDKARQEADRQTPHIMQVKRRHVAVPKGDVPINSGGDYSEVMEPEWKDEYVGDLPSKSSYQDTVTISHGQVGLHALPSTMSEPELKMHISAARDHNGIAVARAEWHHAHPDATFHDWVHSPEFADHMKTIGVDPTGSDTAPLHATRRLVAKFKADKAEQDMIDERRGLEGTVKYDSGLPTWDEDGKLEPQTWADIEKRQKGVVLPGAEISNGDRAGSLINNTASGVTSKDLMAIHDTARWRAQADGGEFGDHMREVIAQATGPDGVWGQHNYTTTQSEPHLIKITQEQHDALVSGLDRAEAKWEADHPSTTMRDYVPTFHTQGLVDDGILYHRQEDATLDPAKLKTALTQGLKQAAKSVQGQTEAHPLTGAELKDALDKAGVTHGEIPYGLANTWDYSPSEPLDRTIVMGLVNSTSLDVSDKVKQAVSKAFDDTASRTRERQLPMVDVERMVRIATGPEQQGGLDALRKQLEDPTVNSYSLVQTPEQKEQLLKSIDIVQKRLTNATNPSTSASVSEDGDAQMRKIFDDAGAMTTRNSQWQPVSGTWFRSTPGDMYMLQDGASSRPLTDEEKVAHIKVSVPSLGDNLSYNGNDDESKSAIADINTSRDDYTYAKTLDDLRAAQAAHSAAVERYAKRQEAMSELKPVYKGEYLARAARARKKYNTDNKFSAASAAADRIKQVEVADGESASKRIEYVPWKQGGKDSPNGPAYRSVRGTLRMHGYTPEEATAKLKELGIVGDLETHVPGQAIFRSSRRAGDVVPLHSAYVRGEAPPPDMPFLITHGSTDSSVSNAVQAFKNIANSGGLMSIADRFKRNISTATSSQAGDIGSGIDHVVFCRMDSGGGCGSGSPLRFAMRPDAAMRRDVLISPLDFGSGPRYDKYKKFRDSMEAETGKEVGSTSLYRPLDPAARQLELDKFNAYKTQGSGAINDSHSWNGDAEFNLAHQVRLEDMAFVAVKDQPTADKLQKHLDTLIKAGYVSRVPQVILSTEWDKHVFLK